MLITHKFSIFHPQFHLF